MVAVVAQYSRSSCCTVVSRHLLRRQRQRGGGHPPGWLATPGSAVGSTISNSNGAAASVSAAMTTVTAASKPSPPPLRTVSSSSSSVAAAPSVSCCSSSFQHVSTSYNSPLSPSQHQRQLRQEHHQQPQCRSFSFSGAQETTTTLDPMEITNDVDPPSNTLTKADGNKEETRRRLSEVPISEVLKAKHDYRWVDPVIMEHQTVREAIMAAVDGGLSGMMVLEPVNRRVVGLITTRDLLRVMSAGLKEQESAEKVMNRVVGDFMTHMSQVIYGRPDETVGVARTLMAKLRIKCLPILSKDWKVEGLLTARDMSDYGLSAQDVGGKRAYLKDVSERVGLSSDTSMAEPPPYLKAHLALEQKPLFVNIGKAALPHPFKIADSSTVKGRGPLLSELATDLSLSEDAHFVSTVTLPDEVDKTLRKFTYIGVADGVGSWREYGVDPREFSHCFMEECQNILLEASRNGLEEGDSFRQVISPAQVMGQAYERVKSQNVIGSTTACIGLFDGRRHQFHFSNLGDSGLIVLRHIDSGVAGALKRERRIPRTERKSDMQVAFVSQQQLLAFNHPYQLGWTGDDLTTREAVSLKLARESCTSSVHVRRGDIVIMATDGLFDNVELDDITEVAVEWEQKHGFIRGGDIAQRDRRWAMGNSLSMQSHEHISELSEALVQRARENSIDHTVDSPFAILAKENDIMWSGGMPDDVTVICLHVVGRDPEDAIGGTQM